MWIYCLFTFRDDQVLPPCYLSVETSNTQKYVMFHVIEFNGATYHGFFTTTASAKLGRLKPVIACSILLSKPARREDKGVGEN